MITNLTPPGYPSSNDPLRSKLADRCWRKGELACANTVPADAGIQEQTALLSGPSRLFRPRLPVQWSTDPPPEIRPMAGGAARSAYPYYGISALLILEIRCPASRSL